MRFSRFRKNIDLASELVGKKFFFRSKIEEKSKYFRRSVYTTKTISKGEKFTKDNLKSLRPYSGLSSNYFNLLIWKNISHENW